MGTLGDIYKFCKVSWFLWTPSWSLLCSVETCLIINLSVCFRFIITMKMSYSTLYVLLFSNQILYFNVGLPNSSHNHLPCLLLPQLLKGHFLYRLHHLTPSIALCTDNLMCFGLLPLQTIVKERLASYTGARI